MVLPVASLVVLLWQLQADSEGPFSEPYSCIKHLWPLSVQPLTRREWLFYTNNKRFESEPLAWFTSQNHTFLLPLVVPLFAIESQSSFGGLSENVLHVILILCRALEVELCIHLLPGLLSLIPQTKPIPRIRLIISEDRCTF